MKTVRGQKWYTPRELIENGLIQNRRGAEATFSGNYDFVLNLINSGKLKAINHGRGDQRPHWLVSEKAIEEYHDSIGF